MKHWGIFLLGWLASLGSAQAQIVVTFTATDTVDVVDANPGDGQCADSSGRCSLRAAIMEANAQAAADPSKEFVINLGANTYSFNFPSAQSDTDQANADDLDVRAKITIVGRGQEQTTLQLSEDSDYCSRLFEVWDGAELTLQAMTIKDFCGFEDSDGGAVYVHRGATLTVHEVTFENNDSDDDGGAIYNEGTLTITNSTFAQNNANDDGGAIYNVGTLTITGGVFDRNIARYGGGAINNDDGGTASIERSIFKGNFAREYGGAIYNYGTLTVTETTFGGEDYWDGNHTPGDGGAIYISSGTATITASKFVRNRTWSRRGGEGGAIDADADSPVLVERSFFYLNSADSQGGAIAGRVLVVNSTFYGNRAEYGGAIYGQGDAKVLFSTIADNRATEAYGGVTNVTVKNSIVARNANDNCDSGNVKTEGVNFTDDESCPGFLQVESDQLGLADAPVDDGTLPLLAASPALGAALDCTDFSGDPVTTDQRGTSRPQGGACDAGAYELEEVTAPSLTATPSQLINLDKLEVSTEGTATFTVTNTGSGTVSITLVGPFNLGLTPQLVEPDTDCDGANLSAGASCTAKLTVSPTGLGRQGAAVRLEIANAEPFYLLVYATGTVERTFVVNTTEDTEDANRGDGTCADANGNCSFRAALQEADAWDGGTFTIRLQEGETYTPSTNFGGFGLYNYGSITIEGNGATIDGGVEPEACTDPRWSTLLDLDGTGELFSLQNVTLQHNCSRSPTLLMEATGQLVLEGVTIQDNVGSGLGVWSSATVRISGSAFFRNKAVGDTWGGRYNKGGGIYIGPNPCCLGSVSPQVHIEDTRFEENEATLEGGALWVVGGQVTVEKSRFFGNRTGDNGEGGAIWVSLPVYEEGGQAGSMVIRNSAILDNRAGSDGGGGIYVGGPCDSGTLKLVNVTIAGNTTTGTGGGIDTGYCDRVDLSFVTITANTASQGGGIYSAGNPAFKRLKGVVLVGNTATQGPDCYGPITSADGNVMGSSSGCDFTPQESDVVEIGTDQVLAARDTTLYLYPLLAGSLALDRVADCKDLDDGVVNVDQRGLSRPQGTACDAGAVEREVPVGREETRLPTTLAFYGHYPNPVGSSPAILVLDLPSVARVEVALYDVLGREVKRWRQEQIPAGMRRLLPLEVGRLASGVYVYRIRVELSTGIEQVFTGQLLKVH
jgi:CSLREA domain-containing protein